MKIYLLNPITTNFTSFKTFLEFGQNKKPYFGQVILSSLIFLNCSIRIGNFVCLSYWYELPWYQVHFK
jgi:hypothetical protein